MKTFRVTIKYYINKIDMPIGIISVVVPAYNGLCALNTTIDANNLTGKVIASCAIPA
jgi:hypothetical protein